MVVAIVESIVIGEGVFTQRKGTGGFAENDGVALFGEMNVDGMFCSIAAKPGRMQPGTIR